MKIKISRDSKNLSKLKKIFEKLSVEMTNSDLLCSNSQLVAHSMNPFCIFGHLK